MVTTDNTLRVWGGTKSVPFQRTLHKYIGFICMPLGDERQGRKK